MFNKKKSDSELPDLPPTEFPDRGFPNLSEDQSLPEPPRDESYDLPELPELPDMPEKYGETSHLDSSQNPKFKTIEIEEWQPRPLPKSHTPNSVPREIKIPEPEYSEPIHSPTKIPNPISNNPSSQKDIFVKIDKFRSARRSLEKTQEDLEEIHELLRKIREVKMKEDRELSEWEKELTHAKTSLSEIRENIFEKVD
jgi:hypothetical protein